VALEHWILGEVERIEDQCVIVLPITFSQWKLVVFLVGEEEHHPLVRCLLISVHVLQMTIILENSVCPHVFHAGLEQHRRLVQSRVDVPQTIIPIQDKDVFHVILMEQQEAPLQQVAHLQRIVYVLQKEYTIRMIHAGQWLDVFHVIRTYAQMHRAKYKDNVDDSTDPWYNTNSYTLLFSKRRV